jgi:uncharacterized protein YkwD
MGMPRFARADRSERRTQRKSSFIASRFVLALLALAASPALVGAQGRINDLDDRVLAAQNRARAEIGVPPLTWDDNLAKDALAWGQEVAKVGYLVHSPDDPKDPDPEGENLWAGTKGYYSAESMIGLWVQERRNYVHRVFPSASKTGSIEDIGHYTQVVWRSTRRVGCALVAGKSDEFLVCRYAEGGNVIGEMTY